MSTSDYYETARENWRILLLVSLLLLSGLALFAPSEGEAATGATNLKYGLELSGGTRVRAPFVGTTAENVDLQGADPAEVEREVAASVGVSRSDVKARPRLGTVEVYSDNVTESEFREALQAADVSSGNVEIRDGVTEPTRDTARNVLRTKLQKTPEISGQRVSIAVTPSGEHFILVEVPNANRSQVLEVINERGLVEVVAVYPVETQNGTTYRRTQLFTQADLVSIGSAQQGRGTNPPFVRVTLSDEAGENFSAAMQRFGFTSGEGILNCRYRADESDPGYCLLTVVDGEVVYSAGIAEGLATSIESGEFNDSATFRMQTTNMSEARELQINLQAGALPTDLDVESGTTTFVQPSLAQEFKLFSLITGVVAAIAVGIVVYVRYGDVRVAAPMLLTALAEVAILLGFAAAFRLPLDLAHIAGFIAVIGTGVDDLVIIADEVLSQGDVRTRRVFQSRFRKALWVIGAAAVTTIIAMSPLTVLSLGDLRGFAVITIIGVLVGVLLTRPAYGDILRALITRG